MFEQALIDKFKKIFELERVRLDEPAHDDKEQETLFVEVLEAPFQIRDGFAQARVKGKGKMIAQGGKMPFGFFAKGIAAHPADTKDLFFYDFEDNSRMHENIVERGFSFIYFFNGQYDPDLGTLESVTTEVETTPP